MALQEINKENILRIEKSLLGHLGITEQDIADSIKEWTDIINGEEPVEETDAPQEDTSDAEEPVELIDLADASLVDKLGLVCDIVLDSILTDEISLKSGAELREIAEAISLYERIKDPTK